MVWWEGSWGPAGGARGPAGGAWGPAGGAWGPAEGAWGPAGGAWGPAGGARGPVEGARGPAGGEEENSERMSHSISTTSIAGSCGGRGVGYSGRGLLGERVWPQLLCPCKWVWLLSEGRVGVLGGSPLPQSPPSIWGATNEGGSESDEGTYSAPSSVGGHVVSPSSPVAMD